MVCTHPLDNVNIDVQCEPCTIVIHRGETLYIYTILLQQVAEKQEGLENIYPSNLN